VSKKYPSACLKYLLPVSYGLGTSGWITIILPLQSKINLYLDCFRETKRAERLSPALMIAKRGIGQLLIM